MKIRNNMKRFLCIALCLCMTVGMLAMLVSCGDEEETGDANGVGAVEEAKAGEVAVIKALADIAPGTQLTAENIGIGYALEEDIPLNAVRVTDKILNKYAKVTIYKGEFIFQAKLDAEAPAAGGENTVVISGTSYINVKESITEGQDAAAAIQDLIDKNPGKALYFPDGVYSLSKPLVISADPAKCVSFRLSNYAIIQAASTWSGDKAMIRIGGKPAPDNTAIATTSTSIVGGIIDGNGKAKAIAIEDGRDVLISNVSIKKAACGITVAVGAIGSINADIENVNITGANPTSSTGMLVQGSGCTFTNVRINNVKTGVEVTGATNWFRNVHAMYDGTATDTAGFYDNSEGNNYDMCFSQNFGIGFRMGNNCVSVFSGCNVFWDDTSASQVAFKADGQFKSVIRSCRADFISTGAYLKVASTGGAGQVLYPIISGSTSGDNYSTYLKTAQIKY